MEKKKKAPGPPPGPPPALSDSEDEEYDPAKGKHSHFILNLFTCWKWVNIIYIQSTFVISTSVISNNHLSRRENLILVLT